MKEIIMEDSYGKKRAHVEVNCKNCDKQFFRVKRKVIEKNFCCRLCSEEHKKNSDIFETQCAFCKSSIKRKNSRKRNSKSGLYFCSRDCKDNAQRYHNSLRIKEFESIMPNHYGTGEYRYRKKAFDNAKVIKCNFCDYSNEKILQVHHIDEDRENNELSNLMIVCPTHHCEIHYGELKI